MARVAFAWFELSACSGLTGKPEVIDVSPHFCFPSIRQNPICSLQEDACIFLVWLSSKKERIYAMSGGV